MDSRTEGSTAEARPGKAVAKRSPSGVNGRSVVDGGPSSPVAKPAPRTASAPLIYGQRVKGLWLHFVNGPVHLIAPGDGTFEFERLYFQDGVYSVKSGYQGKIGSQMILGAELDTEKLTLTFTDYTLQVPTCRISGNWTTPAAD